MIDYGDGFFFFLWRTASKSKKGKIREIMSVEHNIIEVVEERRLKWFVHFKTMGDNIIPKNDA